MYAERRLAFEKRIKQIIDDHCNAYPGATKKSERMWWDLQARILSALEDSFQMGKKVGDEEGYRRGHEDLDYDGPGIDLAAEDKARMKGIFDSIAKTSPFQPPPVTKYSDPRSCPDCHADHDHAALGCFPCVFGKHELPPEVVEQQRRLDAADRMVDKVFAPPTPDGDEKNG